MRSGRTRARACFQFNVQMWPGPESNGGSVAKKPHSDTRTGSHLSSSKSSGYGTSTRFSDSKKKGSQGGWDS